MRYELTWRFADPKAIRGPRQFTIVRNERGFVRRVADHWTADRATVLDLVDRLNRRAISEQRAIQRLTTA